MATKKSTTPKVVVPREDPVVRLERELAQARENKALKDGQTLVRKLEELKRRVTTAAKANQAVQFLRYEIYELNASLGNHDIVLPGDDETPAEAEARVDVETDAEALAN